MTSFQKVMSACIIVVTLSVSYYLVIYIPQSKIASLQREKNDEYQSLYIKASDECDKEEQASQDDIDKIFTQKNTSMTYENYIKAKGMSNYQHNKPFCIKNKLKDWGYDPIEIMTDKYPKGTPIFNFQ